MVGFTESLNISASVAICLNTWITKINAMRLEVGLSQEEMDIIKLDWFRAIVKRSDLIEAEFLRSIH
jgi:tRNA (guanosine-2'-O-)-methyltransferase